MYASQGEFESFIQGLVIGFVMAGLAGLLFKWASG